jgi:RNA polymerase sigma-70 factor (ECF subfamily)
MDAEALDQAVRAVLAGNRGLYRSVVEACEIRVRLALAALLPDGSAVEDLAQETFVLAFSKLDEYRPGTDFVAWLQAIARNLARNERRRWIRARSLDRRYRALLEERVAPRLERLSAGDTLLAALRDCVSGLQGNARGVVEAFYFDELSSRRIGDRYRRPASWVLVVLHRARAALARCLKSKGALADEA